MTTPQLALDLAPLAEPDYEPDLTIQQRFDAWVDANPWVVTAMETLVADWLTTHSRVGIKQMFEVLRWEYGRRFAHDDQGFRVNNDFTSRMARLLLDRHPEWAAAIETRALRAA